MKQTIACKRESPCKSLCLLLLHDEPRLHVIVSLRMYGIRERSIVHMTLVGRPIVFTPFISHSVIRGLVPPGAPGGLFISSFPTKYIVLTPKLLRIHIIFDHPTKEEKGPIKVKFNSVSTLLFGPPAKEGKGPINV